MEAFQRRAKVLLLVAMSLVLLPGCTDWKKKYEALNVEHENLKGLMDREKVEKNQLSEENQQLVAQLQKQINVNKVPVGKATGFEGYEVAFDPNNATITVTLPNSILFDPGKAELKKTTVKELDGIYAVLQNKYKGMPIDVIGNTDSDPIQKSNWKDNWELSSQRSLSVLRYMTSRGIPENKIRAVGRGDSNPVAPNTSASGKAKNRRVEIVVHLVKV
jgi:chemotaxis protein MotB